MKSGKERFTIFKVKNHALLSIYRSFSSSTSLCFPFELRAHLFIEIETYILRCYVPTSIGDCYPDCSS